MLSLRIMMGEDFFLLDTQYSGHSLRTEFCTYPRLCLPPFDLQVDALKGSKNWRPPFTIPSRMPTTLGYTEDWEPQQSSHTLLFSKPVYYIHNVILLESCKQVMFETMLLQLSAININIKFRGKWV